MHNNDDPRSLAGDAGAGIGLVGERAGADPSVANGRFGAFAAEARFADVPERLRNARRWLLWKLNGNRKVPFYVSGGERGRNIGLDSPEDLAKLATFGEAVSAVERGGYSGLGFALGRDGAGCWQGVDLDHLTDHPELADVVASLPRLSAYVERSPSGNGLHAIGYGQSFNTLGSNKTGIEAYSSKRFFTVTGDRVGLGAVEDLADFVQQQLAPRHSPHAGGPSRAPSQPAPDSPEELADDELAVLLADLRDALTYVPSDDYHQWTGKFGHGLKTLGDQAWPLFDEWSAKFAGYDARETRRKWDSLRPVRSGYKGIFAEAQRLGWVNPRRVTLDDFYAYLPEHNYVFMPTREPWPAASVNARLPAVLGKDGKSVPPSAWLDRHRAVEQLTWAPGEPPAVRDRLMSDGGWVERRGCTTLNLYRPPTVQHREGDVQRWRDHIHPV